jgi:hypothetical protein
MGVAVGKGTSGKKKMIILGTFADPISDGEVEAPVASRGLPTRIVSM